MFLFKIILLFSLSIFTFASEEIKKTGFFTNEDCLKKGHFKDCSLDSFSCGYEGCFKDFEPTYHTEDNFVLYVHKDRKYYKIDARAIKRSKLDKIISKNNITIEGDYNSSTNIIIIKNLLLLGHDNK